MKMTSAHRVEPEPILTKRALIQQLEAAMQAQGYRFEISEDRLTKRVIRPDGTVGIWATRTTAPKEDA